MSGRIVAFAAATVLLALVACSSSEQQEQTARMTVREYAQWCDDINPITGDKYSDLTAAAEARYLAYRDLTFSGRMPITLWRLHRIQQETAENVYRFSTRQDQDELVDTLQLILTVLETDNPGDVLTLLEAQSLEMDDTLRGLSPEVRAVLEKEGCIRSE